MRSVRFDSVMAMNAGGDFRFTPAAPSLFAPAAGSPGGGGGGESQRCIRPGCARCDDGAPGSAAAADGDGEAERDAAGDPGGEGGEEKEEMRQSS